VFVFLRSWGYPILVDKCALIGLAIESVDEYSAKVEQLGGKVRMSKSPVPNMGYFAVCSDTENNTFALWETDDSAK
jgi:predicted enzyme related to lactoylglutathione lyase